MGQVIGISYKDLKSITINELNALGEGYIRKTENDLNTQLKISHQMAALVGIAINRPKEYPQEAPQIELEHLIQDEQDKEKLRLENLKKVACRMWGI